MLCTVVYGLGRNHYHRTVMPVKEAFEFISRPEGWAFCDIYYNDRLVFTTQGLAGYSFICDDCPYHPGLE